MKYLLDTNVISELKRPQPNTQVLKWFATINNHHLYMSVLSLGEIRKGIEKLPENQRKKELYFWLENDLSEWFGNRLLPIDKEIADRWGKLQATMNRPLPAIDSLLAATRFIMNFV